MTTNLTCSLDDIRKILGHLGQDYFHDFGATRADKFYVYEIINHPGQTRLDGGSGLDNSEMSILEIEIEKTIDILQRIYPNITINSIFDPSLISSITPYHTVQNPNTTYYTAQYPSNIPIQKPQYSLSDPISSVSGPNQIGGVPYHFKNKWKKEQSIKAEKIKKEIDKEREKKDRELALKFQEEERKSRFSRTNRGIPILPSNFELKCEKWDDSLDHYFTLNNTAYQVNETRKMTVYREITGEIDHEEFINIIDSNGVFYKKKEILELIENKYSTYDPYNHNIFKHYYDQVIKNSTFKNYINRKIRLNQGNVFTGFNQFGAIPSLEPNQKRKVRDFNKNIINYWGRILGVCNADTYERKLKEKLNGTTFKDEKIRELFMLDPGQIIQPYTLPQRKTIQEARASIPTSPPWNNKDSWQDIQKLSNNSCAIKYAHATGLLNDPPLNTQCFPSTTLDGSSGCPIATNQEVFDISINDGDNEYMRFRLQIDAAVDGRGDVFSIHFDIRHPDNKDEVCLSHTYINTLLSNPLYLHMYRAQTGFYTDQGHLLFDNTGRNGITLGLIVKLFCLILVTNPGLNPWENNGFTANKELFASIFFLKECGDLFQELFACKKSITDDHHIYLTNDVPSALRYLLFMSLFQNSNGWGGYLHNSNKGIDMIIGMFNNQPAPAAAAAALGRGGGTLRRKERTKRKTKKKLINKMKQNRDSKNENYICYTGVGAKGNGIHTEKEFLKVMKGREYYFGSSPSQKKKAKEKNKKLNNLEAWLEFSGAVKGKCKPSLLYYSKDNCKECKKFNPIWKQLEKDFKNEINTDHIQEKHHSKFILEKHNIKKLPALIFIPLKDLKEDGPIYHFKGKKTRKNIDKFIRINMTQN